MFARSVCISLLLALLGASGCVRNDDGLGPANGVRAVDQAKGERGAGGRGGAAQKQVVEVIPVVRRDLVETLPVVGSFEANESAEIRPEIAGLVREILFEEGQTVKKGEVLLKIDDSELRAQFEQVEARFRLAELNVQRSEGLSVSRSIPQAELDRARSEFAAARAEHALLRARLEKTEVKAPFDGIVGGRVVSPGDYVTAQTIITTIDDLSRLKVSFQVPEQFLSKVEHGTSFVVRSRALDRDRELQGTVYFVSSVIDRSTRSSEVKGYIEKPPRELKPGMFATVELVLDVRKGALTVPEGAILISSSGSQVIAVKQQGDESIAEFVPVSVGLRTRGLAEIRPLSGTLQENQPVVASGVGALVLYAGARLDPKPLREEFRVGE